MISSRNNVRKYRTKGHEQIFSMYIFSGVFWRGAMEYPNGIDIAAWKYLAVVVPIIVFFAPLGSLLSSYFHRQVLAALVYGLDTVALVSLYIFTIKVEKI